MNLKTLIDETADRADEILDGCTNPSEARVMLIDLLAAEHPALPPSDRKAVVEQVASILESEGFFETGPDGAATLGNDEDNGDASLPQE